MKKSIVIGIIITIVLIIILSVYFSFNKESVSGEKFVIPKYVSVFLASTIENNERVPVLVLSADAGSGCYSAPDLEIKKELNGNTLVIDIKGYEFIKGSAGVCLAIMESRAKVSIDADWLEQNGDKEIIFKLAGYDNKYRISYSQFRVALKGIQATNVITNQPGGNPSDTPVTLEMTLYPVDVAVIYLAGSVSLEKDYRPAMRNFAQTKGFTPAEEVYSGLEQNKKRQFYVVVKNHPLPDPTSSGWLGNLPNEGVGVYLRQVRDADSWNTRNY